MNDNDELKRNVLNLKNFLRKNYIQPINLIEFRLQTTKCWKKCSILIKYLFAWVTFALNSWIHFWTTFLSTKKLKTIWDETDAFQIKSRVTIALVMLFIASLILFFFSSQNILHWNAQPVINETCALVLILIHWHQAISNVQLIDNSHESVAAQKAAIEKNRQVNCHIS